MKALLVIASIAAALALVSAAAAQPGGAQVVRTSGCVSSPLATMCYDVKTVANLTTTPSGNTAYILNGTSSYSYDFGFAGCTYSRSQPVHVKVLEKDGEGHVRGERLEDTISFNCGPGFAQTCTGTLQLHEVDGEVQFQRVDFVCTTP
jgi:hypothetical protein